jgi:hypothetical protein
MKNPRHPKRKPASVPRRALSVIGLTAIAVSGVYFTVALGSASAEPEPPAAPALSFESASCVALPDARRERVVAAEALARSKWARYPFDARDGLAADALLGEAESCATSASAVDDAARLGALRSAWQARLDADYRSLELRLRVALARGDTRAVVREASAMRRLVSAPSTYADWLDGVVRHATEGEGQ